MGAFFLSFCIIDSTHTTVQSSKCRVQSLVGQSTHSCSGLGRRVCPLANVLDAASTCSWRNSLHFGSLFLTGCGLFLRTGRCWRSSLCRAVWRLSGSWNRWCSWRSLRTPRRGLFENVGRSGYCRVSGRFYNTNTNLELILHKLNAYLVNER